MVGGERMHAILNASLAQRLASLLRLLLMTTLFSVSGIVAISAWQAYGDAAKRAIAMRASRLVPVRSPRPDQAGVTVGRSMQPTTPAERAEVASAAAPSAETTQLLQSLTRDVAAMGQDMAELKERIGRLAAGQDQMSRDLAKMRQPNPRPDVRSAMAAAPASRKTRPQRLTR